MKKLSIYFVLIGLVVLLFFTIVIGVSVGTLRIPFEQTYTIFVEKLLNLEPTNVTYSGVVWKIRMPRVLMGVVVGAGLSLCGIIMQAVVQNPLAEPFLLGI
jgi:iron complex transport system permease protein